MTIRQPSLALQGGYGPEAITRTFSKLKLVKDCLRSSMGEDRTNSLVMLSVEHKLSSTINYDDIINHFASIKARKAYV